MKVAVFLIWIYASKYEMKQKEFPMSDWNSCIEASKAAKIVNNAKDESVTVFCAVK